MRPRLELPFVARANVVDHVAWGDETSLRKGVGDDLGTEVEVGVPGADDDGTERLARVEDGGRDSMPVGAGEGCVHHERLGLARDEDARLVERRRRRVEDGVVEWGHGVLALGAGAWRGHPTTARAQRHGPAEAYHGQNATHRSTRHP